MVCPSSLNQYSHLHVAASFRNFFFFIPTTLALLFLTSLSILFYVYTTSIIFINHHQHHHLQSTSQYFTSLSSLPVLLSPTTTLHNNASEFTKFQTFQLGHGLPPQSQRGLPSQSNSTSMQKFPFLTFLFINMLIMARLFLFL